MSFLHLAREGAWAAYVTVAQAVHRVFCLWPYEPTIEQPLERMDGRLEVRPSLLAGAGDGLFTRAAWPAGSTLGEYAGSRLTFLQYLRSRDWTYMYWLDRNEFVDPRHHPRVQARYANHHFEPDRRNGEFVVRDRRVYLRALRDLAAGEEIYVDYGELYWRLQHRVAQPPVPRRTPAVP